MPDISRKQIAKVHALLKALCMEDDSYRALLIETFRVDSCKRLNLYQAAKLIRTLEEDAVKRGVWKIPDAAKPKPAHPDAKVATYQASAKSIHPAVRKYDDLLSRSDCYASPAQLRMLEAMWFEITGKSGDDLDRTLGAFLNEKFERSALLMVERRLVRKVVLAFKTIKKQQTKPEGEDHGKN